MYKRIPEELKKKRGPQGPSKYTEAFADIEADALLEYANNQPLPFLNKFSVDRGYYPEVISDLERVSEKFSQTLKKAKALLEYKLTVGCLAGKINPSMAIFALKNVAGWRDNALIDQSSHHTYQVINYGETKKDVSNKNPTRFVPTT